MTDSSSRRRRASRTELDPILGQVVDEEFSIDRALGTGSHADVFLAKQRSVGDRPVALKVLCRPYLSLREPDLRRASIALLREGKLIGALHAPCFVDIYRTGAVPDGRPYVAMEYAEGPTLAKVIATGKRLRVGVVRDLIQQLAEGLAELHSIGYVHRDVTPANIILTRTSLRGHRVKMVDFGTATRISGRADRYRVGYDLEHPLGTPAYMAPEQATGGVVDGRADQFAVAACMFEALTGRRPVMATEPGARGQLLRLREDGPIPETPLRHLNKDVPDAVADVLERALHRDPERRYAHMAAFASALMATAEGGRGRTRRSGLVSRFLGDKGAG